MAIRPNAPPMARKGIERIAHMVLKANTLQQFLALVMLDLIAAAGVKWLDECRGTSKIRNVLQLSRC